MLYFPSALTVKAAEAVEYISDPLTGETETINDYTLITQDMDNPSQWQGTESNGYYVLKEDITINGRIEIDGDIHLILEDGCKLNAEGGLHVSQANSLTIYGQEDGTGTLEARTSSYNAAIGGSGEENVGNITINGGTVNATSSNGAGIGGGERGNITGSIRINGGNVTATSGSSGAGIGGGVNGSIGGSIRIDGGRVTATSGSSGAGIGGGIFGSITGSIAINGGNVTATSGSNGAGIGGGQYGNITDSGNIHISGGEITATSNNGAGIGSGWDGDMTGTIRIDGGSVTATSSDGAGIGSGGGGDITGDITISESNIKASGVTGAGIGSGESGDISAISEITITDSTIDAYSTSGAAIGLSDEDNIMVAAFASDKESPSITISGETTIVTNRQGIQGNISVTNASNLKVPYNQMLVIKEGSVFTNTGTITSEGTFINEGVMANNGVFYNFNEFIRLGSDTASYTGNEPIEYLVEKISLRPSAARVKPGNTLKFNADITGKGKLPDVEWQVTGAASADTKVVAGEDETSTLQVGQAESADTLTVTVSCAELSDSSVITVTQAENKLEETVAISARTNAAALNRSMILAWKNKTGGLRVHWAQIPEADGYDIFAAQSKKVSFGSKPAVTITNSGSTTAIIRKVNGKKLKSKNNYKVKVRAYRMLNGKKKYIGSSMVFHVAGKKSDYTNAKKIRLTKKTVTVKKGRQTKIQAVVVKQKKNKILLPKRYVANLRYESSNKKIASVTRNGRIKAKNRGTCTIYVTAANGVRTQVKVMVK